MKSRLIIFFLHCLSLLSLATARALGSLLGALSWHLNSRMARITRTNLALCYPQLNESERLLLAKDSVFNTCKTITEGGAAWLWPAQKVFDHILGVDGLAILQQAVARGRGVVVLAPHLGNWEILGLYLDQCGFGQSSQLYQAPRDPRLGRLIFQARSRAGARMVATDQKGVMMLLKSLKRGELAGILPDQVPPESGGDFAPFFGQEVLTMTLASRLLQKTGAQAVIGFAVGVCEGGKAGWRIVFRMPDPLIYAEHILTSLTAMNSSIEAIVNEYPRQYQWEYKRFKRVPAGITRPY